jgi:hypothetical protein
MGADSNGLQFSVLAADPKTYDHTLGGGNAADVVDKDLNGFYFACGDRASIFVVVSVSSSSKISSSQILSLNFGVNPALVPRAVSNNCGASSVDNTKLCASGSGVVVSTPVQSGENFVVQVSRLNPGTVVVLRLDFVINCVAIPNDVQTAISLASYKIGSSGSAVSCDASIVFKGMGDVLNCDDKNACTTDKAVGEICHRYCSWDVKNCDDGSACTTDSCDSATGKCLNVPIKCDDGVACTLDSCDAKTGCKFSIQSCCDNDACTLDSCDPTVGCVHTPITCDDGNACTDESCDPVKGCIIAAKCCCDSDECTTDYCDPAVGCVHDEVICNDNDACTDDSCDPERGCVHSVSACDDYNACTEDWCTACGGCQYSQIDCNDGNECTTDNCEPSEGCTHITVDCNDNDACTDDYCFPDIGCQ